MSDFGTELARLMTARGVGVRELATTLSWLGDTAAEGSPAKCSPRSKPPSSGPGPGARPWPGSTWPWR